MKREEPLNRSDIISKIKKDLPADPLCNLPVELQQYIVSCLVGDDVTGIFHVMLVNKTFYFLANNELVWQDMCYHHYYMLEKTQDTWYKSFKNPPPAFGIEINTRYELLQVLGGTYRKILDVRKIETREIFGLLVCKVGIDHLYKNSRLCYKYLSTLLYHPFLIRCHEFIQPTKSENAYVVIENIKHNLENHFILKNELISKTTVQFLLAQIILATQFMYNNGIYIKCCMSNIMLESNGYIKIAWLFRELLCISNVYIDCYEYSAPEYVRERDFNMSYLFWGFGCLIYELIDQKGFIGDASYCFSAEDIALEITNKEFHYSDRFDDDTKDLLSKLLEKDPNIRMHNFEECKKHKFFQGIDWDALLRKQLVAPDELHYDPL